MFGHWVRFCHEIGCNPSLSDVLDPESKICHLLVFALRYRHHGRTNNPVRVGSVRKALLAVGSGITNMGQPDPRFKPHSEKLVPVLSSFLKKLRDEDDPEQRAYPANATLIQLLPDVLDTAHNRDGMHNEVVIDLIIVAFFFLLRPSEYTFSAATRSQAFCFRDVHFTIDQQVHSAVTAPLHDANTVRRLTAVTLTFTDQKNAVKGELIGHRRTGHPKMCPVLALYRICRKLRHWNAHPAFRLSSFFNRYTNRWEHIPAKSVTNALRHAGAELNRRAGHDYIPLTELSARSLRPGGATALLCADVDSDHIKMLGRWKSDAMFTYLRVQAATVAHNFSARMLQHGHYTFTPTNANLRFHLPNQTPANLITLLDDDTSYDDIAADEELLPPTP